MTTSGQPAPTDWQAICGLYASPSSQKLAVCLAPEAVCVARGPACSGFCIHHSAAAVDGGSGDLGQPVACGAGVPIPPQRRPGATDGGTQTYCPLTDDVCCPAAAGSDGGAAVDGGAADGGPADGGPADLASRG
jgi:hypothetical protein